MTPPPPSPINSWDDRMPQCCESAPARFAPRPPNLGAFHLPQNAASPTITQEDTASKKGELGMPICGSPFSVCLPLCLEGSPAYSCSKITGSKKTKRSSVRDLFFASLCLITLTLVITPADQCSANYHGDDEPSLVLTSHANVSSLLDYALFK